MAERVSAATHPTEFIVSPRRLGLESRERENAAQRHPLGEEVGHARPTASQDPWPTVDNVVRPPETTCGEDPMRNKLILSAILALLLAAATVPLASATGGSDRDDHARVIVLTTTTAQSADLDLGAEGFSVGDSSVFSDDVSQNGKQVGTTGGECIVVRIDPEGATETTAESVTVECVVTLSLPDGQITVQGLVTFTNAPAQGPFTVAITGGTGKYRTAHGEVEVRELSPTEDELTVKLMR